MKKWKWLDEPITWRTSLKVSAWYTLIYGVIMTVLYWEWIADWLEDKISSIKRKLNRNEE